MTDSTQIPARAGVGLKAQHYEAVLSTRPDLGFFEVHAENYMGLGGVPHHYLETIRRDYSLSLHGVGLSLGGAEPLDEAHLARLKALAARYEPGLVSEHLAWSSHGGAFLDDLLPLPYTQEALQRVSAHVDRVQSVLGRRILLENPARYLAFEADEMSEAAFLAAVAARSGCGLLLDVNNVVVSASNLGFDVADYLAAFPLALVEEIHLAGHARDYDDDGDLLLIDAHDRAVDAAVWRLFAQVIARGGPRPTLIEWDNQVPTWPTLLAEARTAERVMAMQALARRRPVAAGESHVLAG